MKLLLMYLLGLLILSRGAVSGAAATARFDIWTSQCGSALSNYTSKSTYKSNLDALLTNITTLNIPYGFYNMSKGQDPDQVQAIAMCRGDVNDVTECHSCISALRSNLTKSCPIEKWAYAWADKCMLRYSDGNILDGKWAENPKNQFYTDVEAGGDEAHFGDVVETLLMSLPKNAAAGGYKRKFAYGQATVNATMHDNLTVYATMQCTPELKRSDCLGCLYYNLFYVHKFRSQTGARLLQPSCSVRYELFKFYDGKPSGSGKKGVNLIRVIVVLAAILATILFLLAGFLIWLFPKQREANKRKKTMNHYKSLEMDSSVIKDATRNFAKANKIGGGRGGLSTVYKGKLHGKEIAVKRIKGTRYLSNDELLSAKLQHTNVVELLGVCLYGKEKLLIFEYVSRGRLDEILFDPKHQELDWEKRYVITQGIAQGLKYLHEEYRVGHTIIHCDLNATNVFLDKHWRPKITDFRTAVVIRENEKEEKEPHPVTPKVGHSVAYMAPEYFSGDEISDKSDVYSFGVLVLEIVAGRRRSGIHEQEDLITLARRALDHGTVFEIIDPKLKPLTDSAGLQMKECVKIALDCLREDAKERPDMRSVVKMLTDPDQPSTPESAQHSSPQPQSLLRNRFPTPLMSPEINQ